MSRDLHSFTAAATAGAEKGRRKRRREGAVERERELLYEIGEGDDVAVRHLGFRHVWGMGVVGPGVGELVRLSDLGFH